MVAFGQLVIGAPGSGKTTYCWAMQQILNQLKRKCIVINLDPANEFLPYQCAIDIRDLIQVEDVMRFQHLGPNGSMVYCMEFLEKNFSWLENRLKKFSDHYLIFDCPGQIELYIHLDAVRLLFSRLTSHDDYRLVAVNLVDAHHCADAGKYISVLLSSLSIMLHMALPHVNIMTKVDTAEKFGCLAFGLDYYTEVLDLSYLVEKLEDDKFLCRYARLNKSLAGLIQDYNLVTFYALNVQDKKLVVRVLCACDQANGYSLKDNSQSVASLLSTTEAFHS